MLVDRLRTTHHSRYCPRVKRNVDERLRCRALLSWDLRGRLHLRWWLTILLRLVSLRGALRISLLARGDRSVGRRSSDT